jgi:hypothetical protein
MRHASYEKHTSHTATAQNRLVFVPRVNSAALVREPTIPTEPPLLVVEVSANFCVVSATDPHGSILGFLDRT